MSADFMGIALDFDELNKLRNKLGSSDAVFARALKSGISSASFHLKTKLRKGIDDNAFGWPIQKSFPSMADIHASESTKASGILSGFLRGQKAIFDNKQKPFYGQVRKLLFYNYDPKTISAEVGVIDTPSQSKIGEKAKYIWRVLQTGFEKPVSGRTRAFFGAIGLPIKKSTTMFRIPSRPLFGPVYDQEKNAVMGILQLVIGEKLQKGFEHTDIYDKAFFG